MTKDTLASEINDSIANWLCDYLRRRLGKTEAADKNKSFFSQGLTSVECVRLSVALGDELKRKLPATLCWDYPSINQVVDFIEVCDRDAPLPSTTSETFEPTAIVGMACRFPGADDLASYWSLLCSGDDPIRPVPAERWNVDTFYTRKQGIPGTMVSRWGGFLHGLDLFDAGFFGLSPGEAIQLDPRQRLALEMAWEALQDAGIAPDSLAGSDAGVFTSILSAHYGTNLFCRYADAADAWSGTGNGNSVVANRVSYALDLHGPSIALDTACSGSLVALHLALQSMASDECGLAFVGGFNIILRPDDTLFFSRTGALSPEGRCRPFDADANGIVRSEGAGMVVLKRLSRARADGDRVYAVLRGSAINQDGMTNGLMAPSGPSQERLLRAAYSRSGIDPLRVQYVEAHGTGTSLGDPIEVQALGAVLGESRPAEQPLHIGSCKSNIGHAEAAAGIAGLIKVALAVHHRLLPGQLHFDSPNPLIPFDEMPVSVQRDTGPWPRDDDPLVAGVSAFGFSGTNAHVVVSEADDQPDEQCQEIPDIAILPLSAHTPEALRQLAGDVGRHLTRDRASLTSVLYSAARRRAHLTHRLAVVARGRQAMARALANFAEQGEDDGVFQDRIGPADAGPVFVLSGQGSHWAGMGTRLAETEPAFRRALIACDRHLSPLMGRSLWQLVTTEDDAVGRTELVQPAIFAMQVACAALLESWGIKPAAVVGQSLGEVAGAYLAGALSLADACKVVHERGQLMARAEGRGRTAVVGLSADDTRVLLAQAPVRVDFAGSSSPHESVVSGDTEAVLKLVDDLGGRGIFASVIKGVEVAFHSAQMQPLARELEERLSLIDARRPLIPFWSSVRGCRMESPTDAAHWGDNLRLPFLMIDAVNGLVEAGHGVFIEIAPHSVLGHALTETLGGRQASAAGVMPIMIRDEDAQATMKRVLARCYTLGVEPDWASQYPGRRRFEPIPRIPWQRRRYWLDELPTLQDQGSAREGWHPLLGVVQIQGVPRKRIYCRLRATLDHPFPVSDHRVAGMALQPGAAWVELALEAARYCLGASWTELVDLQFEKAMILPERGARRVHLILDPDDAEALISIHSSPEGEDEAWVRHVRVKVQPASGERQGSFDLAAVRSRCRTPVEVRDHVQAMRQLGLEYGPRYQPLEEVLTGEGEALGRIRPGVLESDWSATAEALDAALQLIARCDKATVMAEDRSVPRLPVSIGRVRLPGPLPDEFWAHVRLQGGTESTSGQDASFEAIADIVLARDDGEVLGEIEAVQIRSVDNVPGRDDCADWFHQVLWRLADADAEVAVDLPGLEALAREEIGRRRESDRLDHYAAQWPMYDQLAASYVFEAFRRLGWRPRPDEGIETDSFARTLGIIPAHLSLLRRLFENLVEARILARNGAGYRYLAPAKVPDTEAALQELMRSYPESRGELEMLRRAGSSLADQLAGRATATDILFGDDAEGLTNLYGGSPFTRAFNGTLSVVAAEAVQGLGEREARVIEVGAGTGATTESCLAALSGNRSHYLYTDISPALVFSARERFKDRPGIDFRVFDLEQAPELQGFESRSFDLVIAANVVHATANLSISMANLRRLLVPGGTLLLIETRPAAWLDLVFGTTEGWWRFESCPLRSSHALLSPPRWLEVLGEAGFEHPVAVDDGTLQGPLALFMASAPRQEKREWLVIAPRDALPGFVQALEAKGQRAVAWEVEEGPGTIDSYVDRLARAPAVGGIIFALDLDPDLAPDVTADALETRVIGAASLFIDIIKGVVGRQGFYGAPVWLVTRGAVAVSRDETTAPHLSALWGLSRVLASEHRENSGGSIDLDPGTPMAPADAVAEVLRNGAEDQIALRGGRRYLARLVRTPLTPPAVPWSPPKPGAYLVTGGLSGIGLEVARWLVGRGVRHLVLLARTQMPPRERFSEYGDHPGVAAVLDLERSGASVHAVAVDIGDQAAMQRFLDDYRQACRPEIRGLVHSAGLIQDRSLMRMDEEDLKVVLRPKLRGAWILDRAFADAELDMFVLFSSVTAVLGTPGQANYAAANAFIDGLAWRGQAQGRPMQSINWGLWRDVGIVARANRVDEVADLGLGTIATDAGLDAFERALRCNEPQLLVIPARWDAQGLPPALRDYPLLAELTPQQADPAVESREAMTSVRTDLETAPADQRPSLVARYLTQVLARLLGQECEQIEAEAGLVALGIDSIMVVELRNRVEREIGVNLPVAELMQGVTLSALTAKVVEGFDTQGDPATPAGPLEPARDEAPLTPGQRSLWIAHRLDPADPSYNLPILVNLDPTLDDALLRECLHEIADRHQALRMRFEERDGVPVQIAGMASSELLEVIDMRGMPDPEQRDAAERLLEARAGEPFDLASGELMKVTMVRTAEAALCLINIHHIIFDGWSAGILVRELDALYQARRLGQSVELPILPQQFTGYAAEVATRPVSEAELDWWRSRFPGGVPALYFPSQAPDRPSNNGAKEYLTIGRGRADSLKQIGQAEGCSLFAVLLTALDIALYRFTGQREFAVGATQANRNRPEWAPLIGYFVNMVLLRADLHGDPTLGELLHRVADSALESFAHGDVPFAEVVQTLKPWRSGKDLVQVVLTLQNAPMDLPGIVRGYVNLDNGTSKFDLVLNLEETRKGLVGWMEYRVDVFHRDDIAELTSGFLLALDQLAEFLHCHLSELPAPAEVHLAPAIPEEAAADFDFNAVK